MALYTHELAQSGSDWAIVGLGLMPADTAMADALGRQDYLYTLTERMTGSATTGVIGSLIDMRIASADHNIAEATITDPMVAIVSLTITEAGYREPATGQTSTCDVLAQCLDARRTANGAPLTILSCDNLPGNGDVTKRAVLAAARRRSVELATWVETTCTFPNSMVDRITPAATTADSQWLHSELGIDDQRPVVAEQFRQWVIEDNFAAGRPNWESVGVLFTDNVHQWELYKLRMLNAGHSCLAYLSALAGVTYVDEAMAHSVIRPYVEQLLSDEAVPTLSEIAGHRREDYVASVYRWHGQVPDFFDPDDRAPTRPRRANLLCDLGPRWMASLFGHRPCRTAVVRRQWTPGSPTRPRLHRRPGDVLELWRSVPQLVARQRPLSSTVCRGGRTAARLRTC
jgi:mannitol 2-dehydrogenase